MRRIQVVLDDVLEREFDRFKMEDHRMTDSDAGRALILVGLEARRKAKSQTTPAAQEQG